MAEPAAILTGDLIGSSDAGAAAVEQTIDLLRHASGQIGAWNREDPLFTRFRGDGWQMRLSDSSLGLHAAIYIAARLRAHPAALASRIAVGIGTVDDWGTGDLSDARGEALEAAGRGLDAMGRLRWLTLHGPDLTALHHIVVDLMAERATRWTVPQAEALAHYIHPDNPTLDTVGAKLGISAQAAGYRLQGRAAWRCDERCGIGRRLSNSG